MGFSLAISHQWIIDFSIMNGTLCEELNFQYSNSLISSHAATGNMSAVLHPVEVAGFRPSTILFMLMNY